MTATPQPLTGGRFVVDFGGSEATGFSSVVIPELTAIASPEGHPLLVLTRGATARGTGTTDLYDWWDAARAGAKDATREVSIDLVAADQRPGLRWRFIGARPYSLAFSPLAALEAGVVFETLTLTFERMEMGERKATGDPKDIRPPVPRFPPSIPLPR